MDEDDLDRLLESHSDPLSNEEISELKSAAAKKEGKEEKEPETDRGLYILKLQNDFSSIDSAMESLEDPIPKRVAMWLIWWNRQ